MKGRGLLAVVLAVPFRRELAERSIRLHGRNDLAEFIIELLVILLDCNGKRLIEHGASDDAERVALLDGS